MRCFGDNLEDRICDLCRETNKGAYIECAAETMREKEREIAIKEISSVCENSVEIDGCIECGIYCGDNDHVECEPFRALCKFVLKK